jgi:ABC-2 type transport system permease protein
MSLNRIKALFLRHLYPLQRDFDLLSDMLYWPMVDTLLWGITSQWLGDEAGQGNIVISILMGLLLWNIIWRSQSEVSRNLMDEIWNNNLVNLFTTPLTLKEWIISVLGLSMIKMGITMSLLIPMVYFLYNVSFFYLGWWTLLFFFAATLTGWWIGFLSAGIVLRKGRKMQTVIWTLPGMLLPFSAIYFPIDRLSPKMQLVSRFVPTSYIFENMRNLIGGSGVVYPELFLSFALNLFYLSLTLWFFVRSFRYSKNLGLDRFN